MPAVSVRSLIAIGTPVNGPVRQRPARRLERLLAADRDERVQLAVGALDLAQRALDELDGRDLAVSHRRGERERVHAV